MGLFQRLTGAFRPVTSPPVATPRTEVAAQVNDTAQLTAAQTRAAEILSDAQQKVKNLLAEAQQEHDETLQGTETRQQRLQSLETRLAAAQQQLAQSLEAKKIALDAQTEATTAQDVAFASLEQTLLERLETSLDLARSELEVTLADQANDSWSQYLTERLEVEQELLDQTALDLLLTAAPVGSHHVAIEYHAPVISLSQTPFFDELKRAQNDIIPASTKNSTAEVAFLVDAGFF